MVDNLANYCTIYEVDREIDTFFLEDGYQGSSPAEPLRPQHLSKAYKRLNEAHVVCEGEYDAVRQYFDEELIIEINRQILNGDGIGRPNGICNMITVRDLYYLRTARPDDLTEAQYLFDSSRPHKKPFWLFDNEYQLNHLIRYHSPTSYQRLDDRITLFGIPVLFTGVDTIVLADLADYAIATPTPDKLLNPQFSGSAMHKTWACRWDGKPTSEAFVVVTE